MRIYRAALVGCGRIGAFIDNEVAGRSTTVLPYSHAAGYEACPRTKLVGGADLRPDVLQAFGERYGIDSSHLYTDYQAMIRSERPEIVSIATQPQDRTDAALFAIDHGARALYCEKPLCSSLKEAAAIVEAVERNGVVFNMGTNRRWHPGYSAMREMIASGEFGAVKTMITYSTATLFNTASHWFDLLLYLNGDAPVSWVQAHLSTGDETFIGDTVVVDPKYQGTIAFADGVTAHLIPIPHEHEHEVICEHGAIRATRHDGRLEVRRHAVDTSDCETLTYHPASSTLRLIEDLVHALDTGEATRGGVRVAEVNTQMIFGFLESHRHNGARITLSMNDSPLTFSPRIAAPRQPTYAP